MTARIQCPIGASLPTPAKRPPLVVPSRALRDHEQFAVRVGPTLVGTAPQDSMRPAEGSDDARRAMAVAPGTGDRAGNT